MNKPLLSICIPTWNREKYLKECLDSIINQEGFDENLIEIVISDNASTDNTEQLVKRYQKAHTNIKYYRNKKNIGGNPNVLLVPSYASGEYARLLSDDDMMSDIALKSTLKVIRDVKPGLILCKYLGFADGKKINYNKMERTGKTTTMIGMNKFFDFLGEIDYDITGYLMLGSLFCFKKDIYTRNINNLLKEHGKEYMHILEQDYFPHSRAIFIPFGNQEKITIIEKTLILNRGGNMSWSFKFDVCRDLYKLINDMNRIYTINKKTYRRLKDIYYYSIFAYIIIGYVRRLLPKKLYNILQRGGGKIINFIRTKKHKMGL